MLRLDDPDVAHACREVITKALRGVSLEEAESAAICVTLSETANGFETSTQVTTRAILFDVLRGAMEVCRAHSAEDVLRAFETVIHVIEATPPGQIPAFIESDGGFFVIMARRRHAGVRGQA